MQLILLLFLIPLVFSRTLFDPHNTHPHSVLPPPHHYRSLSNNFAVTYIGSPPSDVQAAVAAAATLLSSFLNTNAVFQVSVVWEDVSYIAGLLGEGGPSTQCHHPDSTHFEHALVVPSLYAALTNDLSGCTIGGFHIQIVLNSAPPSPWYTGTDGNTPPGQIDLVSVAMHELVHGMGFITGVTDGVGTYSSAPDGTLYDWYLFTGQAGWPAAFNQPVQSPCLVSTTPLTSNLFYYHASVGGTAGTFRVYVPNPFQPGSSVAHINPSGDTGNSLMFPSIGTGTARHSIGPNVWSVFATFGYPMMDSFGVAGGTTTGIAACTPTCGAERVEGIIMF